MDNQEYEESKDKVNEYTSLESQLKQVNTLLGILRNPDSYVTTINISVPEAYADKDTSTNLCLTTSLLQTVANVGKFPEGVKESIAEVLTNRAAELKSRMEDL